MTNYVCMYQFTWNPRPSNELQKSQCLGWRCQQYIFLWEQFCTWSIIINLFWPEWRMIWSLTKYAFNRMPQCKECSQPFLFIYCTYFPQIDKISCCWHYLIYTCFIAICTSSCQTNIFLFFFSKDFNDGLSCFMAVCLLWCKTVWKRQTFLLRLWLWRSLLRLRCLLWFFFLFFFW